MEFYAEAEGERRDAEGARRPDLEKVGDAPVSKLSSRFFAHQKAVPASSIVPASGIR